MSRLGGDDGAFFNSLGFKPQAIEESSYDFWNTSKSSQAAVLFFQNSY
jgi:hypothetical protein